MTAVGTSATSRGDLRMSACRAQTGPAAEMVGGPNLTHSGHRYALNYRDVMECLRVPGLVRLDVRRPDHLGPLLGFFDDEFAKVGWRANKRR